jgi:hypothetical protein
VLQQGVGIGSPRQTAVAYLRGLWSRCIRQAKEAVEHAVDEGSNDLVGKRGERQTGDILSKRVINRLTSLLQSCNFRRDLRIKRSRSHRGMLVVHSSAGAEPRGRADTKHLPRHHAGQPAARCCLEIAGRRQGRSAESLTTESTPQDGMSSLGSEQRRRVIRCHGSTERMLTAIQTDTRVSKAREQAENEPGGFRRSNQAQKLCFAKLRRRQPRCERTDISPCN